MNTTHLYNKARKAWLSKRDLETWALSSGFNLDELLDAVNRDMGQPHARPFSSQLSSAAYGLAIGIEIGKLLCDPATHLESSALPHVFTGRQDRDCELCGLPDRASIHVKLKGDRAAAQDDPRGEHDR